MRTAALLAVLFLAAGIGWPCAFPDGKGNAYVPVALIGGTPQAAWSKEIGGKPTPCAVVDDKLLIGSSNIAACYELPTGKQIWKTELRFEIIAPPAQLSGRAIFTDAFGNVYSLDLFNGKTLDVFGMQARVEAPPIVSGGDLYVAAASGKLSRFTPDLKETMTVDLGSPLVHAPIIHSSGIIQSAIDGNFYTVNPESGNVQKLLQTQKPTAGPCFGEGLLNVPVGMSILRFRGAEAVEVAVQSNINCTTSFPGHGGPMLVATDSALARIDGDTVSWKAPLSSPATAVSTNGEVAVVGCKDGSLLGLKVKDGEKLWSLQASGSVKHPIVMLQSGLVVTSGTTLTYFQIWDINPEPATIDLGHVPTGEETWGAFSMSNPSNSPGPVEVSCKSEIKEISISPPSAVIVPGGKAVFTVTLNSEGIKEGRYESSISVKAGPGSYKVKVAYTIVPQPFVATLVIGNKVMKMRRGKELWDVALDEAPYLLQNRTMVPLRAISESFGPKVNYVKNGCGSSSRVDITLGGTVINHCIGSNTLSLKLSGQESVEKSFDVPSEIKSNRTFVPIRFIAEAFLAKVDWDSNTKTVIITYQPP